MIDCRERKLGVKNGLFDFVFGSFLFPASSLEIDLTEVKKSIKNYSIKLPLLYFEKQILAPTRVIVIIFDFHCKPNPTGKKKIFPK